LTYYRYKKITEIEGRAKMNNEETVRFISDDGFEFIMEKKAAVISKTISNMLMNSPSKSCFVLFL
jgi:hypothetical protein